jgi:hypothetical protein
MLAYQRSQYQLSIMEVSLVLSLQRGGQRLAIDWRQPALCLSYRRQN